MGRPRVRDSLESRPPPPEGSGGGAASLIMDMHAGGEIGRVGGVGRKEKGRKLLIRKETKEEEKRKKKWVRQK